MFAEQLRKWWHATPFVPFDLVLNGGERHRVAHPDLLAVSPGGRMVQIWKKGEDYEQIDAGLIASIETVKARGRSPKKKRLLRART